MYTTETDPVDQRTITLAFMVCAHSDNLNDALKELETMAAKRGATAIVSLRISATDGTYYIPAETFIGGGTTQRDMGSPGTMVDRRSWTVYGTAIKRLGDEDPPPPGPELVWNPNFQMSPEALELVRRKRPKWT